MRKSGFALLEVLGLLTAGIALFDWNLLKGYVEARVEAATGRRLEIDGNFDVDLGWEPRIRMERVTFANTDWGSAPSMFRADVLEFSVKVRDWLRGRLTVPEARLSRPSVLLEKHPDGRANRVLERNQRARGGVALLLGALALPAAIISFIETGSGRDSDCRALIDRVEKRTGASPS